MTPTPSRAVDAGQPWVRFEYAVLRVVPRVERGEQVNAGVVLFCRARRFLAAHVELSAGREAALRSLAPDLELDLVRERLEIVPRVCAGAPDTGPIGALSQAERFHWVVAPQSTIIQAGPVHTGICRDPAEALAGTVATMLG